MFYELPGSGRKPTCATTPPNAMPLELAVAQIGQAEPEILVSEVAPPGERPTTSPRTPRRTSNSQLASPLAEGLQQRWSQILETLKRAKGNRYTLGAFLRDCPNEGINILKDEHKLVARCQHVQNFNRLTGRTGGRGSVQTDRRCYRRIVWDPLLVRSALRPGPEN